MPVEGRALASDVLDDGGVDRCIGVSLTVPEASDTSRRSCVAGEGHTCAGDGREPAMKSVGKPDAGNPHVRFDERGRETGCCQQAQATAPFLDSTKIPNAFAWPEAQMASFWPNFLNGIQIPTAAKTPLPLRHMWRRAERIQGARAKIALASDAGICGPA